MARWSRTVLFLQISVLRDLFLCTEQQRFFLSDFERDDKPGYVADGHLSRPPVTRRLKQPTRKQTGRLMLPVRPCFGWGLHVPSLLPVRR